MAFLDQVAQLVLEKYAQQMHSLCLVTPNRRAGLFLKKHFAQRITKATWAPDVLSMEDFIARISGVTIQEPVALLLTFYKIYCQVEEQDAEPLDEFLKWAPMLLKDFNDIDAHVEDPHQLFRNLSDVKRLEAWNPEGQPPTAFQLRYLKFFERIPLYYDAFREHLQPSGIAWQGLAYRWAADAVKSRKAIIPWQKIVFTGFNALNLAEETIIRHLIRSGQADALWDTDRYYLDNPNHEAGHFLRKYRDKWGLSMGQPGDHFSVRPKNIKVLGIPRNVNQAKLAGNILAGLPEDSFRQNQTAVVLASEELLMPMIHSVPHNVERLNITLGYPLRKTPMYGFFDAFFQMHLTSERMKTTSEGLKSVYYYKDLLRIFMHPCAALLAGGEEYITEILQRRLNTSNRAFHSFNSLGNMCPTQNQDRFAEVFGFLFESFSLHPARMPEVLLQLIHRLDAAFRNKATHDGQAPEQAPWFADFEALYPLEEIVRKLQDFLADQPQLADLKTLFMLFQSMARESRLALVGEPLNGLQIMGMLETRNLDFENLIILSANEDILPAARASSTFIPYDIKAAYNMPVHREKDAVFAYHFYRLLQRASNVWLVYNTQTQDLGSSEKSRFITQLQMEMPAWNPNISIEEHIIALPPATDSLDHEIVVPKSQQIMQQLWGINDSKGFSPSTLIHYIRCPLLFYFRHLVQIRENERLQETLEANTLGTVVHEVLQNLYEEQGLDGQVVQPGHINQMFSRVEALTAQSFEKHYPGGELQTGKNLLLSRVALRFVRNFLKKEKAFIEELATQNQFLTFVKAEENLRTQLNSRVGDTPVVFSFSGFADRIDRVGELTRIIDYKTGKVEERELRIQDWESLVNDVNLGKSFQLMMYAFLSENAQGVVPGIFSLRNISQGLLTLQHPEGSEIVDGTSVSNFKVHLEGLMQQIFDSSIPFRRTPVEENCIHCEFRQVCNR